MKILAMGNFSSLYVKDSWVEPLRRLYNAVVVDIVPYVSRRDFDSSYCTKYVESLVRQGSFDYLFFYTDGVQLSLTDPEGFFKNIRKKGVRVLAFHADDEPEFWYNLNVRFEHRYDMVATHSRRGWQRRQDAGWADRALYLQWGYNPRIFHHIPHKKKKYDIVFIGKCKADCDSNTAWEDGIQRIDLIGGLYDFCKARGLTLGLFGVGWDKHPYLCDTHGGILSTEEMVRVYNEARIVFNPAYSADEDFSGYQTKLRHFEVAGCGSFQLTNENPDLPHHFTPDKEIVFYRDRQDLYDKILYYLDHEEEREAIAKSSHERALLEHTTDHRLDTLFKEAQKLYPLPVAQQVRSSRKLNIAMAFVTSGIKDAAGLVGPHPEKWDFIHFLPDFQEGVDVTSDYRPVEDLITSRVNADVLTIRSLVYTMPDHENFIQVNRYNFNGVFLTEDTDTTHLDRERERGFSQWLNSALLEGIPRYFINYLVKPEALPRFVQAFSQNDEEAFKSLSIVHTCRVVNEVCITGTPTVKIPYFHVERYYDAMCRSLAGLDKSLAIYGARGEVFPVFYQYVKKHKVRLLGFIDRALAGKIVDGCQVYQKEDLDWLNPDVVVITALLSGPEIHAGLIDEGYKMCIVPAYNLHDTVWEIGY